MVNLQDTPTAGPLTAADLAEARKHSTGRILGLGTDLTGMRFTRLTVVRAEAWKRTPTRYECMCDCGALVSVTKYKLIDQKTKSCGCYSNDMVSRRNVEAAKHNMSGTATYATWRAMVVRCTKPNAKHFASYGGRGISVCDKWMAFGGFFDDMGEKPPGMSLDRIDNNGNYEPSNCRWATTVEQNQNKRTNNQLTFEGVTACAAEWARRIGISKAGFYDRLKSGLSISDALNKPIRKGQSWLNK